MERTFVLSEEMGALTPRRWDRKQRRQLINDFNARIELARTQPTAWPAPERLLDARDESVFRVAHAYRNALYHGDRHNAGLGRSLAVEYLQAVGRTLVRSWSAGGTIGGIPASDARLRAFRRLGSASARSSFQPRTVADECVRHLVGRFRVQRKTLCQQLERDLEERARRVDAILDELGRRGIARPLQSHFLRAALLWAAYRADPELVRLEDEHAAIVHNASGRTDFPNDDDAKAYAANQTATQQRREALGAGFRPPVTIATARNMPRSARTLRSTSDTSVLLERYRTLDERLWLLEQAVTWVDIEVERMAEREVDRARGK
jgi:hypothetical protein